MAPEAPARQLQVEETPQGTLSLDAGSLRRIWFSQGVGLAAIMLIGVYSMGCLEFLHESPSGSEKRSGHEAAVAGWYPAAPGIRSGGLRGQQANTLTRKQGREAADMLHMSTFAEYQATRRDNYAVLDKTPIGDFEGKGFGGGEATRDPEPTYIDPNDPKSKQQAIHKAQTFADYMAERHARETAPTYVEPNGQQARKKSFSFEHVYSQPVAAASEDAAKAAWLAKQEAPAWGQGSPTSSKERAEASWLAMFEGAPAWTPTAEAAEPQAATAAGAAPVAAPVSAASEDAAKAAWLAKQEAPVWGQSGSALSEERAKAAWLARQEPPAWGQRRADTHTQ